MRRKSCKHCGGVFETDKKGTYLCPECAVKAKRNSVYRERVCVDCGKSFLGYPKSKRCPECQKNVNKARDIERHRNGAKRKLGSIDLCQNCGKEYVVESGLQRYCKDCAEQTVHNNVNAKKREYMVGYTAEHREIKKANRSYNKVCLICGKVFDSDTPTVTCSAECAKRLKAIRNVEAAERKKERMKKMKNYNMTEKQKYHCLSEIPEYTDRDAYISDLALSDVWEDEETADIPQERIEALGALYDAFYRSIPEIIDVSGLSMIGFSRYFYIPYRTVQNWCARGNERRECPVYVRLMLQELLGII
jgi:uncharacterized Zn ribbon protein